MAQPIFATMTDAVFAGLGETILYAGTPITAICRHRSEMAGSDTLAIEDRLEVDGRYSDVPSPAPGAAVVRSSVAYVVDRITRQDDYVWRASCRAYDLG